MSSPGDDPREPLPSIRDILGEFFPPYPDNEVQHRLGSPSEGLSSVPTNQQPVAGPPELSLPINPVAPGAGNTPSLEGDYQEPEIPFSSYLSINLPSGSAGSADRNTNAGRPGGEPSPSLPSLVGPARHSRRQRSTTVHPQPDPGPSRPQQPEGISRTRSTRGSGRRYECPVCQKLFTRPSSLSTHLTSHTKERPFTCPVPGCGRSYTVKSNMRRHLRSHQPEDYAVDEPMDPLLDHTQLGPVAGPSMQVEEEDAEESQSIVLKAPYCSNNEPPNTREEDDFRR